MSDPTPIRRLGYLLLAPYLSAYSLLFFLVQFRSLVIDINLHYKQQDFVATFDSSGIALCSKARVYLGPPVEKLWSCGIKVRPSDRTHSLDKDWLFPGWRSFGKPSESPYVANPPALSEWSMIGVRYTEGAGVFGQAKLLVVSHDLVFGILITVFLLRSFFAHRQRDFGATLCETTVVA